MKKVIFYGKNELLCYAIKLLNTKGEKRTISISEYQAFYDMLLKEADKQNITIECIETQEESYFDEIKIDEEIYYHLKPFYTIKDIREYLKRYLSVAKASLISKPELIQGLDGMNREEELKRDEFQKVNKRYQLSILYKIFQLEKEKRELEKTLKIIEKNSQQYYQESAQEYLSENPDIGFHTFNDNFGKRF